MKRLSLQLLAVLLVVFATLVAYSSTLFAVPEAARYPWGSDTWGHLIKIEFLQEEVNQGRLYPNIYPGWYAGTQLFRYYAPLPYYALLGVHAMIADIFTASSWFIYLCALAGGLSFLLYQRWIGLFPATLGGILFTLLPDNIRVAFAEGNLPRVLAISLLPVTFHFLLETMDRESEYRRYVGGLALLVGLIILSHAMIGAITVLSLGLFCLSYWFLGGGQPSGVYRAALALFSGLLLSGWWLLPSLTGGITELNQSAVSEALVRFPLSTSLNPLTRFTYQEQFYIGLGLGLGMILGVLHWTRLGPKEKALFLVGGATMLATTTFFSPIFNSLPMHHLFWPIRFTGFLGFALLLAMLSCWKPSAGWRSLAVIAVLLVTTADFAASTRLIRLTIIEETVVTAAQKLQDMPAWRVATVDLSLLASSPSYWLSQLGKKEQIYGWGYQGARIASNVSGINYAIENGLVDYAIDRLELLGTDDLLILDKLMSEKDLEGKLLAWGYRPAMKDGRVALYHKDGTPRAFRVGSDILGIGSGAQNVAFLFPKITIGQSPNVDDYDPAFLSRFKALVLSRFSWADRSMAEKLMIDYAQQGGTVLVDLTGSPNDVYSRGPKFLGVYGEPLHLGRSPDLTIDGSTLALTPFDTEGSIWQAHTPQGLDKEVATFDYSGQVGVALGYKAFGGGRIWFTGLNLPYHAFLTRDRAAIRIIETALGSPAGEIPKREAIPLHNYRAGEDGYTFSYYVAEAADILIPVAAHEGAAVYIDGNKVKSGSLDNLVLLNSPAGEHQVRITFEKGRVYSAGIVATGLGLFVLLAYLARLPELVPGVRNGNGRWFGWSTR